MASLTRRRAIIGGGASLALSHAANARANANTKTETSSSIGSWTPMAAMPFPVQEIYPTAYRRFKPQQGRIKPISESVLINAGGLTPDPRFPFNVTAALTIYDPRQNQWRLGPSLPDPAHHISLASNSGEIYAIGGFLRDEYGGWRMQNAAYVLEDLDGPWYALEPLPIPQAETVTATARGRVHVIGGRSPSGSLNAEWGDHIDTDKHWMYVASEDRWVERRPMPFARNSAAGAVYNNAIYVIGGRTVGRSNTPRVDVYDPLADRWQIAAPLPVPFQSGAPHGSGGLAAASYNGKIYAFGGEWAYSGDPSAGGVYREVFEYDPREDKWRSVAAMPRPRHGLGAVALEDGIYLAGGALGPSSDRTTGFLDRFTI
ncbi:MAG: hypothetical protein AAF850_08195 [Pseudomonadota bacterium]